MDLSDLKKSIVFEIIERLYRFLSHLEEIERQFYLNDNNGKHLLLNSFQESLYTLLWVAIKCYKEDTSRETLKDCLDAINQLHGYLTHLPHPLEPVELTRLKRIIQKQIVILNKEVDYQNDISFYANEGLGESINLDPLFSFKKDTLNNLITKIDQGHEIKYFSDEITRISHITIPRIDSANPYRWPSLLHEFSHSLLNNTIFDNTANKDIVSDFLGALQEDNRKEIEDIFLSISELDKDVVLKKWLTEIWCDLFATLLIGPSIYFSQFLAFLNQEQDTLHQYPPATFRLFLIDRMLVRRFKGLYSILEPYIINYEELINYISPEQSVLDETKLVKLKQYFNYYFNSHFFSKDDTAGEVHEINSKLKSIVSQYSLVDPCIVERLKEQLNQGIPIPSVALKEDSNYKERSTTVQEIFISGWLARLSSEKDSILTVLDELSENLGDIEAVKKFYKDNLKYKFQRFDQAILKSIQVSEWFEFYCKSVRTEEEVLYECDSKCPINHSGVLVDFEIKKAILSKELQIVPIMDLKEQLGTTSIDIRLGTTFELFSQNQYGIIDYTDDQSNKLKRSYSQRINLDFLQSITITPGQFLLAHSMEYIKLCDYICAELEGRSSFARLGIEIHMTAGFIDPGFEGVITLEICNAGTLPVKLYPGMRIGQLRFLKNAMPEMKYSQRHHVKYKGLLEHHNSKQASDIEIERIREYLKNDHSVYN